MRWKNHVLLLRFSFSVSSFWFKPSIIVATLFLQIFNHITPLGPDSYFIPSAIIDVWCWFVGAIVWGWRLKKIDVQMIIKGEIFTSPTQICARLWPFANAFSNHENSKAARRTIGYKNCNLQLFHFIKFTELDNAAITITIIVCIR